MASVASCTACTAQHAEPACDTAQHDVGGIIAQGVSFSSAAGLAHLPPSMHAHQQVRPYLCTAAQHDPPSNNWGTTSRAAQPRLQQNHSRSHAAVVSPPGDRPNNQLHTEPPYATSRHSPTTTKLHAGTPRSTAGCTATDSHQGMVVGDLGEEVVQHVGVPDAVVQVGEGSVVAVHRGQRAAQPVPLRVGVAGQGCT